MLESLPKEVTSMVDGIERLEKKHYSMLQKVHNQLESVKSFLGWNPIKAPCGSESSCAVMAQVANGCNFGRILTQTTYQLLNLQAHVLAIAANVACGCIHLGPMSRCFVKLYTFCEITDAWRRSLLSSSTSSWEAVKGMTEKKKSQVTHTRTQLNFVL